MKPVVVVPWWAAIFVWTIYAIVWLFLAFIALCGLVLVGLAKLYIYVVDNWPTWKEQWKDGRT